MVADLSVDSLGAPVGRRLLLVRHGRTAWNAEGRAQGHAQVPLDAVGRAPAEEVAPVLAAYDPVLLVSSDLTRARETAAFVEKATGLSAEEDPRLREYDVGVRTGLTREEFAEQHGAAAAGASARDVHAHAQVEGAESAEDVVARIVPAVREVLDRLEPGQTAVLVLHGAALKIAVVGLLGWPVEHADDLAALHNCAWAELCDGTTGRLRLAAYDRRADDGFPG